MIEQRSPNQKPRIIGNRQNSGEIPVTTAVQGVFFLLAALTVGAYLTIGLQQVIHSYDYQAFQIDGSLIHNKSVFPLSLLAIAIGAFGGYSASWAVSAKHIRISGVGLGLLGGFGFYQVLSKFATGSDYYTWVALILTCVALFTFGASGGFKKLNFKHTPHPCAAKD